MTCRVLKLARRPYYRWLERPVTDAELVEAYRANALFDAQFDAHRDDPEFGYRFLLSAVARRAVEGQSVTGCVVHSDRGSQFRSRKYVRTLKHHDLVGSMGQVGTSADNTAMESFFALFQKNVLNRKRWATRDELRIAIITWIERTYHRRRRQDALGRLTPIEYETIMTTPATQAA